MKYEITKGSEKDFEGAPEWATLLTKTGGQMFFVEKHEARARVLNVDTGEEDKIDKSPMPGLFDNIKIIAERRPITEPVWDGEGLPQVGCEVEYQHIDGWIKTKVLCVDGDVIFHKPKGCHSFDSSCFFRPIRSPEDVAKDEAIESMAEIIEYRTGCSPKPLARWLYEAGYRKME